MFHFPPVQTDYAIYLFDNGEKNMVASMLRYAEESDRDRLDRLDFQIVFAGVSVDAIAEEPFCHYPDKLLTYTQLGVTESIDRHWKRSQRVSEVSLDALCSIQVRKRALVSVSCGLFGQVVERYLAKDVDVLVLRDNPNPAGETDYFVVADQVQRLARHVLVPSEAAATADSLLQAKTTIIGHAPTEEWVSVATTIDRKAVLDRLGLQEDRPIVVYAGVYGDSYPKSFQRFLDLVVDPSVQALSPQVLVVPHPRFKGADEEPLCVGSPGVRIVGSFFEEPSRKIATVEALVIADVVVTADPTSTIVIQRELRITTL